MIKSEPSTCDMKKPFAFVLVSIATTVISCDDARHIQLIRENSQLNSEIIDMRLRFQEEKYRISMNALHEKNRMMEMTWNMLGASESRTNQLVQQISEMKSELRRCRADLLEMNREKSDIMVSRQIPRNSIL